LRRSAEDYPDKSQDPKTGELLVREGFISPSDVEMALSIQTNRKNSLSLKPHRLIGMILCNLNLITPIDLYFVLSKYHKVRNIDHILINQKHITEEKLTHLKSRHNPIQESYFDYLISCRIILKEDLQNIIFELYHIPYKKLNDFNYDTHFRSEMNQLLKPDDALECKAIPLAKKESTLLLGITDPESLILVRMLSTKLTSYRFKIIFVSLDDYGNLFKKLYGKPFPGFTDTPDKQYDQEKSPDMSLLFSFKTILTDPETEKKNISALYKRYEILRELNGTEKRMTELNSFTEFITEKFHEIKHNHGGIRQEYYLKKKGLAIEIIAVPITEN